MKYTTTYLVRPKYPIELRIRWLPLLAQLNGFEVMVTINWSDHQADAESPFWDGSMN
jgi:hypothetical protein